VQQRQQIIRLRQFVVIAHGGDGLLTHILI
jgi:hypothetical protein